MFLTGRIVLLTGLGVVPVIVFTALGINPWLVAGAWILLVAGLAGVDVAASGSPGRVEVSRRLPARVRLGESVETQLLLHNRGTRRIRGLLRDAWQPTAGAPAPRIPIDIPAEERRAVTIPLLPRRRGVRTTEFVVIRAAGPLALAGRQARIAAPGAVRVLPPFASRRHLPSRVARLRELDGNTSVQVRGQGTEFDSLREYVRGDDVRSIDWRATARAGTTMLRTWRPERDRHVVIVIDTGRTSAARVDDGVRLDAAMEGALLLAALAERAGDHVHLLMYDRVVRARVTGIDGPALLPALVDAMAPVEPQLIDTDWAGAFAQVRRLTSRPSLVVVMTAQDAPEASRGFLGSLGLVTRGAALVVGTVADGTVERMTQDRTEASDVYRAAAAERTLRDAESVARAVARAGGDAMSDTPERFPVRIADRYLELKAAGRL